VRIDIPALLVHEREKVVAAKRVGAEAASMKLLGGVFRSRARYERAQRLARFVQKPLVGDGWIKRFPPGPLRAWGRSRDLPAVPPRTFREWWESDDRA
jgi:L-lactate dehydrogenase complex protein LldF